jgi:hypothetical protein
MAVRHNRMLRPAVKNSSTGWSGPSGWARITTAHASLPRSTAFAGSAVGDVSCGRWTVTAGEQFVCSISIRHTAAMSGNTNVDWYSGGVYLSTSSGATIVAGAGTTARYSTPVVTAPATADEGVITVNGIDGATEITAGLAEPTTTLGESFFDGDTTGAVWDGTNGSSTSTLTVSTPVVATVDFGAVTDRGHRHPYLHRFRGDHLRRAADRHRPDRHRHLRRPPRPDPHRRRQRRGGRGPCGRLLPAVGHQPLRRGAWRPGRHHQPRLRPHGR